MNPYKLDHAAVDKDALRLFGFLKAKKPKTEEKQIELPLVNVYSDQNRVLTMPNRSSEALNWDSPHILDIFHFEERVTRILYPGQIREMTSDERSVRESSNFPRSLRSLAGLNHDASDAEIDQELERLLSGNHKSKKDFTDVTEEDDPDAFDERALDGLEGMEEEFHKDISRDIYQRTFGQPKASPA